MKIESMKAVVKSVNDSDQVAVKQALQMEVRKSIADALNVDFRNDFDVEKEYHDRVNYMKNYMKDRNLKSLVLGVSGGVDSLTAALICQSAVTDMRILTKDQSYNFIAVKLPYKEQKDAEFVEMSLETISPNIVIDLNIGDTVDAMMNSLEQDKTFVAKTDAEKDFIKGNVKARARMTAQYAVANTYQGTVIGTDHASEAVTGFFTKFGDGGCDVTPLTGLVKGQVRELAKYRGAPNELYEKVATADLEELAENKPDEDALGVSYDDIDKFLLCKDEISMTAFTNIATRYISTEHKRQQPANIYD